MVHAAVPIARVSFFALSTLILAGTRPFVAGNIQTVAMDSGGTGLEASLYLAATSLCIGASLLTKGQSFRATGLIPIALVLCYCGVSLAWSVSLVHAAPRFAQVTLVTFALFIFMVKTPPLVVLNLVAAAFAVVMFADLASVLAVQNAIHHSATLDEKLIGAWKGVHIHKNYAGAVAAAGALIFYCRWKHRIGRYNLALMALSLVFMIGTSSKTSILICIGLIPLLEFYACLQERLGRAGFLFLCTFLAVILVLTLILNGPDIWSWLAASRYFSARTELWAALAGYISHNPVFGSGYGSFWRTGIYSPILGLTDGWGIRTGQGHNGYLDTIVTLGVPGFLLTLYAFFVAPLLRLLLDRGKRNVFTDVSFVFVVFCLLHNLMETSILNGNNPVYLILMVGIGLGLAASYQGSPDTHAARSRAWAGIQSGDKPLAGHR